MLKACKESRRDTRLNCEVEEYVVKKFLENFPGEFSIARGMFDKGAHIRGVFVIEDKSPTTYKYSAFI